MKIILLILATSFPLTVMAGDIEQGEEKAKLCVQCHGKGGNQPIVGTPKIGGQHKDYILYALRAYKSGKRDNALMSISIDELSDQDFLDLSAYFANQKGDLSH